MPYQECTKAAMQFQNWFAISKSVWNFKIGLQFLICTAQFQNCVKLQIVRNIYIILPKVHGLSKFFLYKAAEKESDRGSKNTWVQNRRWYYLYYVWNRMYYYIEVERMCYYVLEERGCTKVRLHWVDRNFVSNSLSGCHVSSCNCTKVWEELPLGRCTCTWHTENIAMNLNQILAINLN